MEIVITNEDTSFDRPLVDFLKSLRALEKTAAVVIPHLSEWINIENEKHVSEANSLIDAIKDAKEPAPEVLAQVLALHRKVGEFAHTDHRTVIFESLYTQIFSRFDAFSGELIKEIYKKNPELFLSGDRKIEISEIKKFSSISDLLDNELLSEIENFRRKSYSEQFTSLETKFEVPLREFKEWPSFIEASQRRNLIIHNNGITNTQYIQTCKSAYPKNSKGINPEKMEIGKKLEIGSREFRNGLVTLKKVAFMLTHTLWRKLFPKEHDLANEACNYLIFDYLCRDMWHVAAEFGSFSMSREMVRGIDDTKLKFRTINLAIAYKFSNNKDECAKLLNGVDWKSSSRDFKMAVAILRDETAEVFDWMRKIGREGDYIKEVAYRSWPLFHEIKNNQEFIKTFEEIYCKKYYTDIILDPNIEHLEKNAQILEAMNQSGDPSNSVPRDCEIDLSTAASLMTVVENTVEISNSTAADAVGTSFGKVAEVAQAEAALEVPSASPSSRPELNVSSGD